jgi:hypothetical protein
MQVAANHDRVSEDADGAQAEGIGERPTRPMRQSEPDARRPSRIFMSAPRAKAGMAKSSARPKKISQATIPAAYRSDGHLNSKIR